MIISDITREANHISKRIESLQDQLKTCPIGSLQITKNGDYFYYRHHVGKNDVHYIPVANESLAKDLAFKKYLELQLADLENYRNALTDFAGALKKCGDQASAYLLDNPGARRLLKDRFPVQNAPLSAWAAQPPATSAPYQEERIRECISGHIVRTKIERRIDNALFRSHIPFRYEDPLTLSGITIHPDFTIRHPKTGNYYYWEHFGMMDNPGYVDHMLWTLSLYARNGICPFQQLIMTFETKKLDPTDAQIDMLIKMFL